MRWHTLPLPSWLGRQPGLLDLEGVKWMGLPQSSAVIVPYWEGKQGAAHVQLHQGLQRVPLASPHHQDVDVTLPLLSGLD